VVKIPDDEAALIRQMHELVRRHPRRGYRLVWAMLRREGWRSLNRKRVHWLWRREGFKVPQKHKKMRLKGRGEGGVSRLRACRTDHVWCVDFIHDRDERGRPLKWLSVVDEFTRECLALQVERSRAIRELHLAVRVVGPG